MVSSRGCHRYAAGSSRFSGCCCGGSGNWFLSRGSHRHAASSNCGIRASGGSGSVASGSAGDIGSSTEGKYNHSLSFTLFGVLVMMFACMMTMAFGVRTLNQRNAIMRIRNASDKKGPEVGEDWPSLQKPRNENTRTVANPCERDEKRPDKEESSQGLL